jgi:hypothetical protein
MYSLPSKMFPFHQPPIAPGFVKLLLSDRMWSDFKSVVRAIFPAIIVLRLADMKRPAMDMLLKYVRQLDLTLKKSKDILDSIQKNYNTGGHGDVSKSIVQYFLSSEKDVADFTNESRKTSLYDNEDESSLESSLESLDKSDDDLDVDVDAHDEEDSSIEDIDIMSNSIGDKVIEFWNKRKKKLEHDLSVAGWMLSPKPEIMTDAYSNHSGKDRDAVERLLKKRYIETVSNLL